LAHKQVCKEKQSKTIEADLIRATSVVWREETDLIRTTSNWKNGKKTELIRWELQSTVNL